MTDTTPAVQTKPARISLSSVCADTLANADGNNVSLDELHKACLAAGLQVTIAQVYAGVQSMASTGKCDRGSEKRTWVALGKGRPAGTRAVTTPAEKTATGEKVRKSTGLIPAEQTIQALTDMFGAPVEKPTRSKSYCVQLPTNFTVAELIERGTKRLEEQPTCWFMKVEDTTVLVGFPKSKPIVAPVNQNEVGGEALSTDEVPF